MVYLSLTKPPSPPATLEHIKTGYDGSNLFHTYEEPKSTNM